MNSEMNEFEQLAQLKVGVRLPMDFSPEDWYEKLREIAGNANVEPWDLPYLPGSAKRIQGLYALSYSGIRSQGGEPRFVYKMGTADLNIVAPVWKCPAIVFGPGDSSLIIRRMNTSHLKNTGRQYRCCGRR